MATPADARLREGIAAAQAKRNDDARALLQQVVESAPDTVLAWFWLAVVAPSADVALAHLRRALALDPSYGPAREAMTKLLVAQAHRMCEGARRLLGEAAAIAPDETRLWAGLLDVAAAPADRFATIRDLREALARIAAPEPQPAPAAPAQSQPQPGPDESAPSSARTVMVIDDSPTIRKILSLTLEHAGYAVVAEEDGESALARLSDLVPDVVLLDIAMPGIDGYETCKRIRSDARIAHLPVLMLSGKDAMFDKVKGHMAGATEYLTKPFEAATVLAAVEAACVGTA